jgi:hypothetical protein
MYVLCVVFYWRDSSFLCCMAILLNKEGRVVDNIQIGCFIELIIIFFKGQRVMRLNLW